MKAFNGNTELKGALLACAAAHREADEYCAGTYGKNVEGVFRACSIGCTTRDVNKLLGINLPESGHAELAAELGIPEFIPRCADRIFEGLPKKMRPAWTERWIGAIPEGADLSLALPMFLLRVLDMVKSSGRSGVTAAAAGVKTVMDGWIKTGFIDKDAAAYAARAARAARFAAYAAGGDGAARSAAYAAAYAAYAAVDAAYAAYAAYAAVDAVDKNLWPEIADALIESIKEAGNVSVRSA